MTNTRPKGLLNIPKLSPAGDHAFDTRAKQMDDWLAELPRADSGESAKRIFQALESVNRVDISDKARLRFLAKIHKPIVEINTAMARHYTQQKQPLSEKAQKIAELNIALHSELALAYKILIEAAWSQKIGYFKQKHITTLLHHAVFYLNRILLISYQIYVDPPPSTWLHFHQLYLYAEENQFHEDMVGHSDYAPSLPECSIAALYKQSVLLGLLSPYRFRQPVVQKLHNELLDWSKHCKIIAADQFSDTADHVLIKLNSDLAPGYYFAEKYINHVYTRTLDTSALINLMRELMINARGDSGADYLGEEILKAIVLTWSGQSKRLYTRAAKSDELTITVGLSATHHYINQILLLNPELALDGAGADIFKALLDENSPQLEAFTPDDDPQLDVPAGFDTKPEFGVHSVDSVSADIWDRDYSSKTMGYSYNLKLYEGQKPQVPVSQYKAFNLNNINESAGGYCLLGYLDGNNNVEKIQIGELIGLREHAPEDEQSMLGVGVVRRIKNSEKGLELGIQKLATYADAVATCAFHQRNSNAKYSRSLVLPAVMSLNQPASILVSGTAKSGNDLIINRHGYKLHVRLTKLLESTGVFSRFEFSVVKSIGVETKKSIREQTGTDDFDNAWTLI